jgi:predicted alpha/beta-hydrolase family hydrolase
MGTSSDPRLIDGPADAPATVLLAHGAGAPMDSPFMAAIAGGLAAAGWPVLQEAFRQQVRLETGERPERPLFIGGKSMGGRVASLLVDELAASDGVRGCLCLGYPFHPPGKPLQLRTEHLAALRTPTLILQGERDTFGRREEVETYSLSPAVQLRWIPSGDHSFKPTRSSGLSEAENWAMAVALSDRFIRELLSC